MTLAQETSLSAERADAILGRHETGVLSLAQESDPYSIPVSYGYDPDSREFYLRLVSTPESEKRTYRASSPRARLVVYEEADPVYRSVVAAGTVLPDGFAVPPESFARGVPATVVPLSETTVEPEEIASAYSSGAYTDLASRHEELFE